MGTGPFEKAFGDGHLTYDLRGSATLALTLSKDIEQQTFAAAAHASPPGRGRCGSASRSRATGTGSPGRSPRRGASTKTEVYAVEAETRSYGEQADG